MASLLSRPTLARRDALFPNKAAADERTRGVAFLTHQPQAAKAACSEWATFEDALEARTKHGKRYV